MRVSSALPPALVLAPGNYMAPLGVMRSLRPLGVKVFATDSPTLTLWKVSRYCAGVFKIGEHGGPSVSDPESTLRELERAGEKLGGDAVLFPASDEWVLFVAENAERLASRYRFARLDPDLGMKLGNKQILHTLATQAGVAVPDSVQPRSFAHAWQLAPTIAYPIVIKTATTRSAGNQMVVVRALDQLDAAFAKMHDYGNLVFQRLIEGGPEDGWLFNGYFDRDSRCLASFVGQKLRQWPADRGITVLAEARRNPEVESGAVRFLTSIGYRGPVDMDFMRDPTDGTYRLLDLNPRLGGVFTLFTDLNGLDVARAMYLDLTGQPVRQQGQRDGRRFVHEGGYLLATLKLHGRRAPAVAWRETRGAAMGTFRILDPLPFLLQMWGTIRVHAGARLGRLVRRRSSGQNQPSLTPAQ